MGVSKGPYVLNSQCHMCFTYLKPQWLLCICHRIVIKLQYDVAQPYQMFSNFATIFFLSTAWSGFKIHWGERKLYIHNARRIKRTTGAFTADWLSRENWNMSCIWSESSDWSICLQKLNIMTVYIQDLLEILCFSTELLFYLIRDFIWDGQIAHT